MEELDDALGPPGLTLLRQQERTLRERYDSRTLGLIGLMTVPVVIRPPSLLTIARLVVLYTPDGLHESETRLLRKLARGLSSRRQEKG
jgi:hypothetical protein